MEAGLDKLRLLWYNARVSTKQGAEIVDIAEIKKMLIADVDSLELLLSQYGFAKFKRNKKELRFARDDNAQSGLNISIHLENNEGLFVNDYARSNHGDIIAYIITEKGVTFRHVLGSIRQILNISSDWTPVKKRQIFGGFYSSIGCGASERTTETYAESVLEKYDPCGNELWLREGIPLKVQRFYDVCFDDETNGIVFPWRDSHGDIIAVKSRYNGVPPEGMSRYYYPYPGNISTTLYNYSESYEDLYNCDRLFVVEGEKTVMHLRAWGYNSVVALGCHSLSTEQARLIYQLQPREVCFLFDSGLEMEEIERAIHVLRDYTKLSPMKITYWDWAQNLSVSDKDSPCDCGKEIFQEIISEEIVAADEPIEEIDPYADI